jgi:DNA-binding PadR family transcriptional regulator
MTKRDAGEKDGPALKPLVFQILLAVGDGEPRHGWSVIRDIQQRDGFTGIMPGHFYRTLRAMVASGLIEETRAPAGRRNDDDERRRYVRLTREGLRVAQSEARRLEALVFESRAKRLLSSTRRG